MYKIDHINLITTTLYYVLLADKKISQYPSFLKMSTIMFIHSENL